jgi:hypothetical protein
MRGVLSDQELLLVDAYWRAANYCPSARSIFSTTRCLASRSSFAT